MIASCILFSGCTLLEVEKESKEVDSSTVLVGWVSETKKFTGPIIVAAYQGKNESFSAVHCTQLHETGGYELIVPNGNYELLAFGDSNKNLRFDEGEPIGRYLGADSVKAVGTGVVGQLDIALKWGDVQLPIAPGTGFSDCGIQQNHSTQAGAIVNLDDRLFSREYGNKAYWKPMEFYREVGGNIYFLEPYDPKKIPILFVHGAAGSPQDWRYFFEHMDRSRYQPWFFYYPSGAAIDSMAHLLSWKIFTLSLKYRFKKLHIVAHSMGGLVVRSFLLDHNRHAEKIGLFVSLATPWGGEPSAELGVKYSPGVVPSWIDMQPQGNYMQSLFKRKLPSSIDYYLLFGFKGGSNLLRPNNDGVVNLASTLRSAAQAEAKQVYGFDEDHVSILTSNQVVTQLETILDSAKGERPDDDQFTPGYVHVASSYSEGKQGPIAKESLWLRPIDRKHDVTFLPLSEGASKKKVGPFPPGEYEAGLVVQSFDAVPRRVRIRIRPGDTTNLSFKLNAQGNLWGYIGTASGKDQLPAGSYVPPDKSVEISLITISGGGIERKLVPTRLEKEEGFERFLAQEDLFAEGEFYFFNLPTGEYRLTVTAEGYLPYSDLYTVVPGHTGLWRPVVLQPEK